MIREEICIYVFLAAITAFNVVTYTILIRKENKDRKSMGKFVDTVIEILKTKDEDIVSGDGE